MCGFFQMGVFYTVSQSQTRRVRSPPLISSERRRKLNRTTVPAVRLEDIRPGLVEEAAKKKSYRQTLFLKKL